MLSLPLHFGTRLESVPAPDRYLKADTAKVALWRARIGEHGFRIGIAWQGNPEVPIDAGRSIALDAFVPLAAVAGVRLISLQKNAGAEQIRSAPMAVEELGPQFDAGRDALAVMEGLDPVISSDTAVAMPPARSAARPGWRCAMCPTGAGCWTATTRPGTRPCACSARPFRATGPACSAAWARPWPNWRRGIKIPA